MRTHAKLITFILLLVGILSTLAFAQPTVNVRALNSTSQTTPVPSPSPEEAISSGPPLSLTLSLLCFCLGFSLIIGVFVLGVMVRMPSRKDKDVEKAKEEHGL